MDKIDEAILVELVRHSRGSGGQKISLSFYYNKFSAWHPLAPEEFQARIRMLAQQGYLRTERAGKHSVLVSPTQAGMDRAAQKQRSQNRVPLIVMTALIFALLGVTVVCVLLGPVVLGSLKQLAEAPGAARESAARESTVVRSSTAVAAASTATLPPLAASPGPTDIVKPTIAPIFVDVTPPPPPTPTALPTAQIAVPTAVVLPVNPPPAPVSPAGRLVQFTDKQTLSDKNMLVTVRQPLIESAATAAENGFNQSIQGYTGYQWSTVRAMNMPVPDPGGFLTVEYTVISRPEWSATSNPTLIYASTETLPVKNAVLSSGHEVVSVLFAATGYEGGAHPNTTYEIINYDFSTGLQLQLRDLFRPGVPYLDTIASYAMFELSKQESQLFPDYRQGAAALPENYRVWGVTPRGLLIVFHPYQIAPGASGAQYVLVPYTALASMLDPQGPLGRYAQ